MQDETKAGSNEIKNISHKHPIVYWVLGFAILSVLLGGLIGIIPIITIILSLVALKNTKEQKSGRWIVISALIVGILYLVVNAYNNGHFDTLLPENINNYQGKPAPVPITNYHPEEPESTPHSDISATDTKPNPVSEIDDSVAKKVVPTESSECRSIKLHYDSCREHLSHTSCISSWDYESACGLVQTTESSECRSIKLHYDSCREHLSHTSCISSWDYESACN